MCSSNRRALGRLVLAVLLFPASGFAQTVSPVRDSPKVELFAGYSYMPELDSLIRSFNDPSHGWGASLGAKLNQHVGLLVDFDAHSWTTHGRTVCDPRSGTCAELVDIRT